MLKVINPHHKYYKSTLFVSYTILFFVIFSVTLFIFKENNTSLIWIQDGLSEHLPKIRYLTSYCRSVIKNLLFGQGFSASYDFSLGLGADVLTYTGVWFLDPFFLLLTFVSDTHFESAYEILIIIKYYIVGISFLIFCLYKRQNRFPSLIGAMVYVFSGFAMEVVIRHPTFLTPMMLLPLLLIALEKTVKNSKGGLFTLLIAVSAISSIYFLFINTIIGAIYYLTNLLTLKEWRKNFVLICIYYLLGIGLSSIIVFPILLGIFDSARTTQASIATPSLFNYGSNRISNFFMYFSIPAKGNGYWMWENFNPITIYAIIHIFMFREKYNNWKALFIIFSLFSLIPAAAFVFSGFSTISNRWCYAYAFVTSFCCVIGLKKICSISKKICIALFMPTIFLGILIVFKNYININVLVGYVYIIAIYTLILFVNYIIDKDLFKKILLILIVVISTINYSILKYSPTFTTRLKQNVASGQAIKEIANSPVSFFADKINDTNFYRIDDIDKERNNFSSSLLLGYNGLSSYNNIMPAEVMDFVETMGLSSAQTNSVILAGFDNRFILNTLLGVKYLCCDKNTLAHIPYNYVVSDINEHGQVLTVNNMALPLGYTYDKYILDKDFRQLSITDKQELLTQAIILDSEPIEGISNPVKLNSFSNLEVPINNAFCSGLKFENNMLKVTEKNATLDLDFKSIENSEVYIYLKGFEPIKHKDTSIYTISIPEYNVSASIRGNGNTYQRNQENMLINLGYFSDSIDGATLEFLSKGTFNIEKISVFCQPMNDTLIENIKRLKENRLENLRFGPNCISGKINLSEPRFLCLSIPYNKGWSAKVNGKNYPILKGNLMFTALALPEGEYNIELSYSIPGLRIGKFISSFSLLGFLGISGYRKTKQ